MPISDVSGKDLSELISLSGRAAVVTGAAGGIGRAVAARLLEAGAAVIIGDIDLEAAEQAASELGGRAGRVSAARLDVTDPVTVDRVADHCVAEAGGLDIWVNNAGIFPATPFLEMPVAEWDRVLRLNLDGTFHGSRAAAARMATGGGGVIVNVASTSSYRGGPPGMSHYSSSKHAILGLTRSLAMELGPHGIRVLGVAPTRVQTPGVADYHRARGRDTDPEAIAATRIGGPTGMLPRDLPLGRTAVPDDVARVVLFCASDLAMLVTGVLIPVDAGILTI
jgi:NAD(P)-dependent dehydrogenase (short-subunit alcohol dehydrogenase family)